MTNDIQKLVDEQAEDEGLWFEAKTAPEEYLQQELRRLHYAIENSTKEKQDDWVLCAAPLTAEESFEAVNTYLKEKEKQG